MNLAIDIGNTLSKAAVIDGGQVIDIYKTETLTPAYLERVLKNNRAIDRGILISTRGEEGEIIDMLKQRLKQLILFDHETPIPIKNDYGTPQTLGRDRLAAAVGAAALRPGEPILIVDFGTAITIDFIDERGVFKGGNISPGAQLRFQALNRYTRKLPLRQLAEKTEFLATSSHSAIESGVVNGIVYEIEGYIRELSQTIEKFHIIFTGGDGNFFAKRLNYPIFASQDLVLYGLNKILEYNAQ